MLHFGNGISVETGYTCPQISVTTPVTQVLKILLGKEPHTMRKILLGAVALIAFAAPAAAADLAARPYTKAPPAPIALVYDWSGFYIGANGGWGSSRKCWDFVTPAGVFVANEGCHDATGGTAGGQVGYRWQSGTWVFGIEGQGNWADFRGSNV